MTRAYVYLFLWLLIPFFLNAIFCGWISAQKTQIELGGTYVLFSWIALIYLCSLFVLGLKMGIE